MFFYLKKHLLLISFSVLLILSVCFLSRRKTFSVSNSDLEASVISRTIALNPSVFVKESNAQDTKAYELLIKKESIGVGDGAYEEGDVVMIQPEGYNWSSGERNNFNIVKVQLTSEQAEELLKPKEGKRRAYKLKDITDNEKTISINQDIIIK